MFSTIKTVESVVNEAIAIVKEEKASRELALNGSDVTNLDYRKSVFPNYRKALSHIRHNVSKSKRADAYDCLMEWAESTILSYRAMMQQTEIKPVVVDEIAELKAALAAKTQECAKVVRELNVVKEDLTIANVKVKQYEGIFSRLQKRTVVIGKTLTSVFVDSKVECKSNFR